MFFANIFLLCTVSCVLIAAQAPEILNAEKQASAQSALEKSLFCSVANVEGGPTLPTLFFQGTTIFSNAELVHKNGTHKNCVVIMRHEGNEVTINCPNQLKLTILQHP